MNVKVLVHKEDTARKRYIGSVYVEGQDAGLTQVENGFAWHYLNPDHEQTLEERKRFDRAEDHAKSEGSGLWRQKDPMPPWEYRGETIQPAELPGPNPSNGSQGVPEPTASAAGTSSPPVLPAASEGNSANGASARSGTPGESSAAPASNTGPAARTYILGPYGGCYYVAASGRKVYVKDKSLCHK
jgi:hypothetical protein